MTTLGPDERVLALSDYQLSMAAGCLEVAAMAEFAAVTNESWDAQEGELKRAARDLLYTRTEQALIGLTAWSRQLHEELLALQAPAGGGTVYAIVELAAARMGDAAEAMLNGLRLPASAEDVPGTARRLALDAFEAAASDLDESAESTLGAEPGLSAYELEAVTVRLEAAGLRHAADRLNRLWDDDDIPYGHATMAFEEIAAATGSLLQRVEAISAPSHRADARALLRNAAIELNRAAHAMLTGLVMASEEEDVPGTTRRLALDNFRAAATSVDLAATLLLGVSEDEWSPLGARPGPHLSPPDVIAPPLEITKPAPGAGIGTRSVTIEGISEPDAAITIGNKLTYADENGAWTLKVQLDRGDNELLAVAVDPAGNETTLEYELRRGYLIGGDRIGTARLGEDPGNVIPWFVDVFGGPHDEELIEVDEPSDPYGIWVGSYLLVVGWRSPSIVLVFADGELIIWSTNSKFFVTSAGIHVGSSLEELEAAYGDDLFIAIDPDYCADDGDFWADDGDPPLYGHVTGPPFNASSEVTYLGGGWGWPC